MELLTHALLSLVLARAGRKILPRYGVAMLVISGVAADLDFSSYLGGAAAFLRFHRSVLHSLPGSSLLACTVAASFWFIARRQSAKHPESVLIPLRFGTALTVCVVGAAVHVVFDLASGIGVQLLWPFRQKWIAWDLLNTLDPWIVALLALGLLLPEASRLVSEEIGERKKGPRGQRAAVVTLLLLLIYVGARAGLHSRAIDELKSREYDGLPSLAAGAFPSSLSPFAWRGVVSTDNAMEVSEVSLAPGVGFDPDRAVRYYKPEDSAALEAAQNTAAARTFLRYARYPLASVERSDEGYRVMLRDMRFASRDNSADNVIVRVELNSGLQVVSQEFRYASSAERR